MIKIIRALPGDGEEPIKEAGIDEDVETGEEVETDESTKSDEDVETEEDVKTDEDEPDEEDRYCGCMGGRPRASAQATHVPPYFELPAENRPPEN